MIWFQALRLFRFEVLEAWVLLIGFKLEFVARAVLPAYTVDFLAKNRLGNSPSEELVLVCIGMQHSKLLLQQQVSKTSWTSEFLHVFSNVLECKVVFGLCFCRKHQKSMVPTLRFSVFHSSHGCKFNIFGFGLLVWRKKEQLEKCHRRLLGLLFSHQGINQLSKKNNWQIMKWRDENNRSCSPTSLDWVSWEHIAVP